MATAKRLYRSRDNQIIGGVCAGIADYFNVDPVLVRVAFVALTFLEGFGAVAYILLWIFVPEEPGAELPQKKADRDSVNHIVADVAEGKEETKPDKKNAQVRQAADWGSTTVALVLVAVGGIFLLENVRPGIDFGRLWPVILVAVGVGMLWSTSQKRPS